MPKRLNILWLMTDEQRADSMGYAGAPWAHTSNLDALARSGVQFQNAYTPSPDCIPARASMLTARAGSSIGVMNNHHALFLDDPQFLTWRLAAAGYQVVSFGKQHYGCSRRAFDLEDGVVLGDRVGYTAYEVPVASGEAGIVRYDGGRTPWLFSECVREGENEIAVTLVSTLRNLLGPHHRPEGEPSDCWGTDFTLDPAWTEDERQREVHWTDDYVFLGLGVPGGARIETIARDRGEGS